MDKEDVPSLEVRQVLGRDAFTGLDLSVTRMVERSMERHNPARGARITGWPRSGSRASGSRVKTDRAYLGST